MMRAVELRDNFGFENLHLGERPLPEPGPGQVRLRIHAAALNFRDLLMLQGLYNPRLKLPMIPLSDGAGEVESLGVGVTRWKSGDRVMPLLTPGWLYGSPPADVHKRTLGGPADGTLVDYIVVHENDVVAIPSHLTYEEAAAIPCAGLTAWSALVTFESLNPGDTVLLLGSGGVSVFALQFAKMMGLRVIQTSGSDEKITRLKNLGADHLINYRTTPDWHKEVLALTNGLGVDHVVEVGGAGTLPLSLRSVRSGGTLSVIGVLAGSEDAISLLPLLMRNIRMQGIFAGSRSGFESLNRALAQHRIFPVVHKVFALNEFDQAIALMQRGEQLGKVVISLDR